MISVTNHTLKISVLLFVVTTLMTSVAIGQTGNVNIYQDEWVDSLIKQYRAVQELKMQNPDNKGIEGYRVQIFFDSGTYSGDRAREVKLEFEEAHETIPAYLTWKAPNYRVRVGDFRSRLEAEKFLAQISKDYPNAWIIKDEINFPNLDQNTDL
jgi:hypothetical protein